MDCCYWCMKLYQILVFSAPRPLKDSIIMRELALLDSLENTKAVRPRLLGSRH